MKEIYKTITDYPNYEVSNLGSVRNRKTGRILKLSETDKGYLQVLLCRDGKPRLFRVHRLVANAFILNSENKPYVNYINSIKTDNRIENLEWCTQSENILHAYKKGLKFKSNEAGRPKQKVRCIETSQEFESMGDAARYFGRGLNSIRASIHKGSKVLKKYHFELV